MCARYSTKSGWQNNDMFTARITKKILAGFIHCEFHWNMLYVQKSHAKWNPWEIVEHTKKAKRSKINTKSGAKLDKHPLPSPILIESSNLIVSHFIGIPSFLPQMCTCEIWYVYVSWIKHSSVKACVCACVSVRGTHVRAIFSELIHETHSAEACWHQKCH